jgi:hypothetical protein
LPWIWSYFFLPLPCAFAFALCLGQSLVHYTLARAGRLTHSYTLSIHYFACGGGALLCVSSWITHTCRLLHYGSRFTFISSSIEGRKEENQGERESQSLCCSML